MGQKCIDMDVRTSRIDTLSLKRALAADLPEGVTAQVLRDGRRDYAFLLNFIQEPQRIDLGNRDFREMPSGKSLTGRIDLEPYDVRIIVQTPLTHLVGNKPNVIPSPVVSLGIDFSSILIYNRYDARRVRSHTDCQH